MIRCKNKDNDAAMPLISYTAEPPLHLPKVHSPLKQTAETIRQLSCFPRCMKLMAQFGPFFYLCSKERRPGASSQLTQYAYRLINNILMKKNMKKIIKKILIITLYALVFIPNFIKGFIKGFANG